MQIGLSVQSSGASIAAEVARLTSLQTSLPTRLATVAAEVGAAAVLKGAAGIRGSLSMSNNKKGRKLDAFPIVRGGASHAEAEIQAVPRGAWHLVEYGAKPHPIKPKRKYGARKRKAALSVPPYGEFANVDHPGTSGERVWERAMAGAEAQIDRAVQAEFDAAVNG